VTTLASLNDALQPINMAVTGAEEGPVAQVEWSVRDGRSLYRFTDDMVRPGHIQGVARVHRIMSGSALTRSYATSCGRQVERPRQAHSLPLR